MAHLIELRNVYKIYPMGDEAVHALDGVSLTIDQGEFVAIVGSSGSGKSTAMNIIGCLDVPTSGTYHLGGVDVSTMDDDQQAEIRNKMLGFIFQQYNLIPKLTVLENVELPLLYAGVPKRRAPFLCNLAGAAFSAAGWVLFSYFFSLFVEEFSNFSIYGGLATLVILMFWLFFCMYIVFLGAEVSVWLEQSGIGADIKNWRQKRRKRRQRKKREKAMKSKKE